jgi:hypothetical protein
MVVEIGVPDHPREPPGSARGVGDAQVLRVD